MLVPVSMAARRAGAGVQLDDAEPDVFLVEDEHARARRGDRRGDPRAARRPRLLVPPKPAATPVERRRRSAARSTRRGLPAARRAPCSPTRTASGRTSLSTSVPASPARTSCFRCCRSSTAADGTSSRCSRGGRAARSSSSASFDAGRVLGLLADQPRVTTMMGVPAIYLFLPRRSRASSRFRPLATSALRGRRRRADARRAAPHLAGARGSRSSRGTDSPRRRRTSSACRPRTRCASSARPASRTPSSRRGSADEASCRSAARRLPRLLAQPRGHGRGAAGRLAAHRRRGRRGREGFDRIVGRLKDMYISGGENVYPAEVEACSTDPFVADAAVVGVPDERWGEVGVAFVVAAEPASDEAILAYCRERLARYKVPKRVRRGAASGGGCAEPARRRGRVVRPRGDGRDQAGDRGGACARDAGERAGAGGQRVPHGAHRPL